MVSTHLESKSPCDQPCYGKARIKSIIPGVTAGDACGPTPQSTRRSDLKLSTPRLERVSSSQRARLLGLLFGGVEFIEMES